MSEIDRALDTIKILNFCGLCTTGDCHACDRNHAKDISISGLKALQQYRAIGTLDECNEAREKQKMRPPLHWTDDYADYFFCPNCQKNYKYECDIDDSLPYGRNYCEKCGQAIDWRNW